MILKKGVTGYTGGDISFERDWDVIIAQFKQYCYTAVVQINGRILAFYEPDVDCSYAFAHVEIDGETLYVFHNNMYDYVAFTSNSTITGLDFIDHPVLAAAFDKRYKVLTVYDLGEPLIRQVKESGRILLYEDLLEDPELRESDCLLLNENDLNDIEIRFMNHFWSRTVGELVFNYWD